MGLTGYFAQVVSSYHITFSVIPLDDPFVTMILELPVFFAV